MSLKAITLQAEKREITGKKVKSLRRVGKVPAVIYERGQDSEHITVEALPLSRVWSAAGKHHIVQVEYDGASRMTLIKDVDFDPVKGSMTHVAFHAIKQNEKVEAEIPVEITGDIPAERLGFFLVKPMTEVQIKALPADLPDKLEVSGETLAAVGDHLTVADLTVPANVEIMTEPDRTLAVVEESRADVEAVAEEVEGVEGEEAAESAADVPSEHGAKEEPAQAENKQ